MEIGTSICRCCNAFCPIDLAIEDGRIRKVEGIIRSRHGQVRAIVKVDAGLRCGVVALMHDFGNGHAGDPRVKVSNVNLLAS